MLAEEYNEEKNMERFKAEGGNLNKIEDIQMAVDKAIEDMPKDFVLKPFLEAHRAEVRGMLTTEYKEEEVMELFKEDGRKEGIEESIKKTIEKLKAKMNMTSSQAMDFLDIPINDRAKYERIT